MKTLKKYILPITLMLGATFSKAQQSSLFNTYALDPLQLNMAYAGASCTEANLHYRTQWIGLKETPKVFQVNAHTAIGEKNGLGLRVNSQNQGLLNMLGATFGYSYRFRVSPDAKVHLGIGAGWSQATMSANKAVVIDANDATLNNNSRQTANGFDSEFGAMYIGSRLKGGISALHLYNSNPDFTGSSGYKTLPQLNSQVSYLFNKGQKIEVEPWLLSRYTINGNHVLEGLVNLHLLNSFIVGAGYRTNYGMMVLLGARLGNFKFGYSFDYGAGKNATNLGTSHQVMLGFSFCKSKPRTDLAVDSVAAAPAAQQPTVLPTVVADLDQPKQQPVKEETKPVNIASEQATMNPVSEENVSFEGVIKSGDPAVPMSNKKIKALNDKGEVIGETSTNNSGAFAFRHIPANQNFIVAVEEGDMPLPEGTRVVLTTLGGKQVKAFTKTNEQVSFKILDTEKSLLDEMKADDASLVMSASGYLYDQNDKPLQNVPIIIKEASGGRTYKVVTGPQGRFNFSNLEAEKNYIFETDENDPSLSGVNVLKIGNNKGKIYRVFELGKEPFSFKVLNADKKELGEFKVEDTELSAEAKKKEEAVTPEKKEEVVKAEQPKQEEPKKQEPVETKETVAPEVAIVKVNSIAEEVVFEYNKTQLDEVSMKKLDKVAAVINSSPELRINIVGHTCNIGSKENNELVSMRRATYIRNELIKRGVNAKNIDRSIGLGADQALYDNTDPEMQKKNRTVRFESVR